MTLRPAHTEPVSDTMSISGWAAIGSPTSGPVPLTMFSTPSGKPACLASSTKV